MHEKIPSTVVSAPAMPVAASVKDVRQDDDKSQTEAAAIAGVSVGAWRSYEIDRNAVTPKIRVKCDKALALMAASAKSRSEAA
jgi:DNA-binding XRE family transcriptional regulator